MPLPAYFLRFITAENQVFCPDSTDTHTLPSGSREQKQTLSHSLLHTQWSFTLRGAPGIVLGFVLWRWRASSCSSKAWSSLPPVFSLSPWVLTSSARFVCVWCGGFFWYDATAFWKEYPAAYHIMTSHWKSRAWSNMTVAHLSLHSPRLQGLKASQLSPHLSLISLVQYRNGIKCKVALHLFYRFTKCRVRCFDTELRVTISFVKSTFSHSVDEYLFAADRLQPGVSASVGCVSVFASDCG